MNKLCWEGRTDSIFSPPQISSQLRVRGSSSGAARQVGFYLQDELLEEEKHERTQRNDFFLGRPWAICSRSKRDKQKSESQDKNPLTSQQTPPTQNPAASSFSPLKV